MRPQQWPKNGLVFAAFVFTAGHEWALDEPSEWWPLLWRTGVLFVLWAMVSSATYLLNDIADRELDQQHPRKRERPIAKGTLRTGRALGAVVVLVGVAVPAGLALDRGAGAVLSGYFVVMLAYSEVLKRVAVLDVLVLSAGVIGRAISGALAIDVEISPWLYVCSGFGAFFFAASKRWAEYRQLGAEAASHRPALAHYSGEILGQMVIVSAAAALLAYGVYSINSANVPGNGSMALTLPFVGFALFRYLLLLDGPRQGDAPDQIVFTDPQIVVAVVGFVATAAAVLLLN
jgi:4-hydroxybenzoate polyprenyltransferase